MFEGAGHGLADFASKRLLPKQTCISMRLDPTAKLKFEVSDGERPMALYCADAPRLVAGNFDVSLSARSAGCKP